MPTFCRHNRFIERCPICRQTLPGASAGGGSGRSATRSASAARGVGTARSASTGRGRAAGGGGVRVRRETRAIDDGYRSGLVPGLRASEDAQRLAREIGFASGRLLVLSSSPPGLYAQARDEQDIEQAIWTCFLIAYLSPIEGEDPFVGIRSALTTWRGAELPELDGVPLGPRTSHDPARGLSTLLAYREWAERAGGQAPAFSGDAGWSAERRFERVFERLALPGLGRTGRFDLLVTIGRLGLFSLRADGLHAEGDDATTLAAKRVFGMGDRMNLERRARALAEAATVPVEALDLALANWASAERATMGMAPGVDDDDARARAADALGL